MVVAGSERGAQHPAVAAGQVHAGVVDQGRFVDGQVQAAVGAQGQGRLHGSHFRQRRVRVQVFGAVPFEGREPPGGGRAGDCEPGQFAADAHFAGAVGLLRELVAEADAVVVDPEHHLKTAARTLADAFLGERRPQFVVVVAGQAAFAPGLLPGFIEAAPGLPDQLQIALQAAIAEQHAQRRGCNHRFAIAFQAVGQAALVARFQDHRQDLAG